MLYFIECIKKIPDFIELAFSHFMRFYNWMGGHHAALKILAIYLGLLALLICWKFINGVLATIGKGAIEFIDNHSRTFHPKYMEYGPGIHIGLFLGMFELIYNFAYASDRSGNFLEDRVISFVDTKISAANLNPIIKAFVMLLGHLAIIMLFTCLIVFLVTILIDIIYKIVDHGEYKPASGLNDDFIFYYIIRILTFPFELPGISWIMNSLGPIGEIIMLAVPAPFVILDDIFSLFFPKLLRFKKHKKSAS